MREQYAQQIFQTIQTLNKLREYAEYYEDVKASLPHMERIYMNLQAVKTRTPKGDRTLP